MRLLILLAFLTGCGTAKVRIEYRVQPSSCTAYEALPTVDTKVSDIVALFFEEAQAHRAKCVKAKRIGFKSQSDVGKVVPDSKALVLGYCTYDGTVVLNQDLWFKLRPITQKAVVFHELGHCVLNLGHAPDDALNLMTPYILPSDQIAENWDLLLDKLFSKSLSLEDSDVLFNRPTLP